MGEVSWLAQCALDFLIDERCHACGENTGEPRNYESMPALGTPVVVFAAPGFRLTTRLLCANCALQVKHWAGPVILPSFDALSRVSPLARVHPAFVTDERLLVLIHLLKFARRERVAPWLAAAMASHLPDFGVADSTASVVTSVQRAGFSAASPMQSPSSSKTALWTDVSLARLAPTTPIERVVIPVPMDRSAQLRRGFNQAEKIARGLAHVWKLPLETRALIKVRATKAQSTLGREERLTNLENAFHADATAVRNVDIILVDDLVTTGATVRACAAALRASGARQVVAACVGYRDERTPRDGRFPQS